MRERTILIVRESAALPIPNTDRAVRPPRLAPSNYNNYGNQQPKPKAQIFHGTLPADQSEHIIWNNQESRTREQAQEL